MPIVTQITPIVAAFFVSLFVQKTEITELLRFMITGYKATLPELSQMLDGGGLSSMVRVVLIVCISSAYSGIFNATGMLERLIEKLETLAYKTGSFAVTVFVSIFTSAISCNQTLAIILSDSLCSKLEKDNRQFAIDLENSVVVIAPLIPWSIAGAVPLTSAGAPTFSLLTAFYLYLIPLYYLIVKRKKSN